MKVGLRAKLVAGFALILLLCSGAGIAVALFISGGVVAGVRSVQTVLTSITENCAASLERGLGAMADNDLTVKAISVTKPIAAVSEENTAATEEVSASAEEMSAQAEELTAQAEELAATAEQLRDLVARFRLENDAPGVNDGGTVARPGLARRTSDRPRVAPVARAG